MAENQKQDLNVHLTKVLNQLANEIVHERAMYDVVIVEIAENEHKVACSLVGEHRLISGHVIIVLCNGVVIFASIASIFKLAQQVQNNVFQQVASELYVVAGLNVDATGASDVNRDKARHHQVRRHTCVLNISKKTFVYIVDRIGAVQT